MSEWLLTIFEKFPGEMDKILVEALVNLWEQEITQALDDITLS